VVEARVSRSRPRPHRDVKSGQQPAGQALAEMVSPIMVKRRAALAPS